MFFTPSWKMSPVIIRPQGDYKKIVLSLFDLSVFPQLSKMSM